MRQKSRCVHMPIATTHARSYYYYCTSTTWLLCCAICDPSTQRIEGETHHACVVRGQQQPAEIIRGTHRAHMVGGGLSIMIPRFFLPSDNQNIQGMASLPVANLSYCPCRWTDRGIHGTSLAGQLAGDRSIDRRHKFLRSADSNSFFS
jgi:hypothetical protein